MHLKLVQYLSEQQELTAVERFARRHDAGEVDARSYRDLIPLSRPVAGQQYAFHVDLDACTGCKACVTACHNLNGLDEGEVWRKVGLLIGSTGEQGVQKTVTAACHHCVDPACLAGCPVKAYEKDPVTGIVGTWTTSVSVVSTAFSRVPTSAQFNTQRASFASATCAPTASR